MQLNPITNQMEMNLQETHLLRQLDEEVERNGSAIIGAEPFGDVTVITRKDKFFAVSVGMAKTAVGVTASSAFLNLASQLRGAK